MELVEVKREHVYCDSLMVSRKFGQKHNKVTRTIEKLIEDLGKLTGTESTPKYEKEDRCYRGRDYTAYLMDRRFFSLLAMRFKGTKALEWQIKFIDAFFEMEEKILVTNINKHDRSWLSSRDISKIARRAETDVIKQFVEYATNQGSKSAKFYYKHITNATYEALGFMAQKQPKLRDSMDIYEVSQLILAEKLAKEKILEYMNKGRNYKDIYKSVKEDLIVYSGLLKIG